MALNRGTVRILDHDALKRRACKCHEISKLEFDQLLGDSPGEPRTDKRHRRISEVG